jgi:hypothetical protein
MGLDLSACSPSDADANTDVEPVILASAAILGGHETEPCEWPAVVSLGGCSGVLVHPRVVLYAAHCGIPIAEVRFGNRSTQPTLSVPTSFCRGIDAATLGDGTDLAACVLSEPVQGIEPARILAGCEVAALQEGRPVTLVGFGKENATGTVGIQRAGVSRIAAIGDDILLDSTGVDTCRGDSGGPLFINTVASDGSVSPRLIGITSSGSEQNCGTGVSHYVNLTRKLDWLQDATGTDLTPCFDGDTWAPTPDCTAEAPRTRAGLDTTAVAGAEAEGTLAVPVEGAAPGADEPPPRCEGLDPPVPLSTCGDPFGAPPDDVPPQLSIVSPARSVTLVLANDQDYSEFELSAEAFDDGWGVREVTFGLRGENGELEFERSDGVAPYAIRVFRVPPGRFTLVVSADDHAGNKTQKTIPIQVSRPGRTGNAEGCRTVPGRRAKAAQDGWALLLLAWVLLSRRWRTRCPHSRSRRF